MSYTLSDSKPENPGFESRCFSVRLSEHRSPLFRRTEYSNSLLTGLVVAGLAAAIAWAAPALAGDSCKVTDPTGAPLDLRDVRMNIIGTLANGRDVYVQRYGKDNNGKPWAYVASASGKRLGRVYREFISCY